MRVRNNGLAIAAMVLGLLFFTWIGAILAVVFGHVSLGQIKRANGWQKGNGMAVAGLVLGYAGLVVLVVAVVAAGSDGFA